MKIKLALLLALLLPLSVVAQDEPTLVLDEDVWVTFYDLPSRRFRNIRDAFLRRDPISASRDIEASASYLRVESTRARQQLQNPLTEVVSQLERIREQLPETFVSIEQLDSLFGRAHWLLSQHFFVMALDAREAEEHRTAGRYLTATAHHMERAVLWSEARISRDILNSLESIREMAGRLQDSRRPRRVYRDEPLRLTARTIRAIGEHIDRRVRIDSLMPE